MPALGSLRMADVMCRISQACWGFFAMAPAPDGTSRHGRRSGCLFCRLASRGVLLAAGPPAARHHFWDVPFGGRALPECGKAIAVRHVTGRTYPASESTAPVSAVCLSAAG